MSCWSGFNAAALSVLTDGEIQNASINIVFAVAEKLIPHPWDYVAVIAVQLSTVGTLETSVLQFTPTVFAMGRGNVPPKCYAQLHRTYRTPWLATLLIIVLGLLLLLLPSRLPGIKTVIGHSINPLSFQIAFYYGLAGLACAWHFRK